jgi:hypothetical protein
VIDARGQEVTGKSGGWTEHGKATGGLRLRIGYAQKRKTDHEYYERQHKKWTALPHENKYLLDGARIGDAELVGEMLLD